MREVMNKLAVGWSARAQQAHKVDHRIDRLHKVDNRIDWPMALLKTVLFRSGQTQNRQTHDRQTYGLRRHITHTDVCSLCATRNGMRAPFAPPIFHMYEKYL